MSNVDPDHEIVVQRLIQSLHVSAQSRAQRLHVSARGQGRIRLDDATVRHIVESVIRDMPDAEDRDRLARAESLMVLADR